VQKIVTEIVIEIGMEQTRLFSVTAWLVPLCRYFGDWNRDWIFHKILTEIGNIINLRTNTSISM